MVSWHSVSQDPTPDHSNAMLSPTRTRDWTVKWQADTRACSTCPHRPLSLYDWGDAQWLAVPPVPKARSSAWVKLQGEIFSVYPPAPYQTPTPQPGAWSRLCSPGGHCVPQVTHWVMTLIARWAPMPSAHDTVKCRWKIIPCDLSSSPQMTPKGLASA